MDEKISGTEIRVYDAAAVDVSNRFGCLPTPFDALLGADVGMVVNVVLEIAAVGLGKEYARSIFILPQVS